MGLLTNIIKAVNHLISSSMLVGHDNMKVTRIVHLIITTKVCALHLNIFPYPPRNIADTMMTKWSHH